MFIVCALILEVGSCNLKFKLNLVGLWGLKCLKLLYRFLLIVYFIKGKNMLLGLFLYPLITYFCFTI